MPEIARVRRAAEGGFEELRGSDALDVPQVEIFVTAQSEEAAVVPAKLGLADTRQIAARTDQRRRIAMLQAAVAAGDDIGQKQVLIELGLLSEHFAFDMADARQVVRQSRQVGFGSTGQHQSMRDAVDIEVDALIVRDRKSTR